MDSCKRNYGIDLLRLVLMFMVCLLHVLGQGGVLSACVEGTLQYQIFWLIEVIVYCAVDGFAFISGYTATNKPQNYKKIVNMWFQVVFYSFFVTAFVSFMGLDVDWGLGSCIRQLFPVTFNQFWYFSAYFALFFCMPILNTFLFNAKESECKKMFILLFVIFSVIGILKDPFDCRGGYSAIWLIVIYCMGVLAKRIKLFEHKKTITLVLLWLCVNLFTWGIKVEFLINYVSPTILLSGILLVLIFSRLPLQGKIIRHLSPLAFGIYLFQLNPVIWNAVFKDACVFVADQPLIVGIIFAFLCAGLVFVTGLAVEFIRSHIAKILKIDVLSQKIVCVAKKGISKLHVFLR